MTLLLDDAAAATVPALERGLAGKHGLAGKSGLAGIYNIVGNEPAPACEWPADSGGGRGVIVPESAHGPANQPP